MSINTNMPEQAVESVVEFVTKNALDTSRYKGTIAGNVNYFGARPFSGGSTIDILAYHQKVRQSVPSDMTIPNNAEDCNYFLLNTVKKDGTSVIMPFAYEWITEFTTTALQKTAILQVVAQETEIDDIVKYIRKKNIRCTVLSMA